MMVKKTAMESKELTVSNWEAMKDQATMLVKSGMIPSSINTPEKAIAIAITSKELGIGMMEGFRSINVIQGKPTISPQLMLALANRTGQLENLKIDATDERCVVIVTRKGRDPHKEEFGVKEATSLGLMGRDNYNKQRATMFKWRALAANLRVTFPDVMLGFYTPEELGAEVKVSDNEEMVVVSNGNGSNGDGYVDTGVTVPKGFKDMTPEEKQERIGAGNIVKMTPKGPHIFTPKESVEKFTKEIEKKVEVVDALISHNERLELIRLVQEKKIPKEVFLQFLQKEYGIKGTNHIKEKDYAAITTWIYANGMEN